MATPNYDLSNPAVKAEDVGWRALKAHFEPDYYSPLEPQLKSGIRVLKFGGGAGHWTTEMANTFPKCTFDLVNKDNYYPTQNTPASVTFHQLEFGTQKLPFADATFEFVVVDFVLQQAPSVLWDHAFNEMFRVLKPGGHLTITEGDTMFYPNEGSTRVLNEAFEKGFEAIGVPQCTRPEIPKQLARLGLTTVSEQNIQWFLDPEEFPDVLDTSDFWLEMLGTIISSAGVMEESEYKKQVADFKSNARTQKTHNFICKFVARK